MYLYPKALPISETGIYILVGTFIAFSFLFLALTIRKVLGIISIIGWRNGNLPRASILFLVTVILLMLYIVLTIVNGFSPTEYKVYEWGVFLIASLLLWRVSVEIFNAFDTISQVD